MSTLLQSSKCAEPCMVKLANSTNNCDVQIVATICDYVFRIVITIAIAYVIIKLIKLFLDYFIEKNKSNNNCDQDKSKMTAEEKEQMAFYNFCYAMAKSTKPEEKELAEKCWEFLKNKYAPTIQNQ